MILTRDTAPGKYSTLSKLREFWLKHKEDILLTLVVVSFFLGVFFLVSSLLKEP